MKQLNEAVRTFEEACQRHDLAKQTFENCLVNGSDFLDAREAFFAGQPDYEAAKQTLLQSVRGLHNRGRLINGYDELPPELCASMLRALREEGVEDLLDRRHKIRSFSELVQAWYGARLVTSVAQTLRDARLSFNDEEFALRLAQIIEQSGEPGIMVQANYEEALESLSEDGADSWEAILKVHNEARKNFEELSDEVIEAVERMRANDTWDQIKQSLNHDIWRALRAYTEQHTRIIQPKEQPTWQSRSSREVDTLGSSS